jgi:hypothetical protein
MYAMGRVAKDSELLFDYGDRYWGAVDEKRPVEVEQAKAATSVQPKRRRVSSGGGKVGSRP